MSMIRNGVWNFTKGSDGYFTIRSRYGDQKYVGISNTNVGSSNVVLLSSITDYAKWKIYEDKNYNLYFEPKNATGKTACVPDSAMGSELQLAYLGATNLGRNTWDVIGLDEMSSHAHIYTTTNQAAHPHKVTRTCECGDTLFSYPIYADCDTCTANQREAKDTKTEPLSFGYWAGDHNTAMGGICLTIVDCSITYSNFYDFPFSITYDYPAFASFSSNVTTSATVLPDAPSATISVNKSIDYFNSSGTHIATQALEWYNGTKAARASLISAPYTLPEKPGYITTSASFAVTYGINSHELTLNVYFS